MWKILSEVRNGRDNTVTSPALYLGNSGHGHGQAASKVTGVKEFTTINVAFDLDVAADARIGLIDGKGNPKWLLRAAVETLRMAKAHSKLPVLIFCHEGRSRSVTTAATYMVLYRGIHSLDVAFEHIRRFREDIAPKPLLVDSFREAFSDLT